MIQLQLDDCNMFGKIAPDVVRAYLQPGESAPLALRPDHHVYLPFNAQ